VTDPEDPTGLVELASNSVAPFKQELLERVGVELDESDVLAIETALLKAFLRGLAEGGAEAAERVIDRGPQPSAGGGFGFGLAQPAPNTSELTPPVPDIDPWAERYGR
jgi:hypothetical protein